MKKILFALLGGLLTAACAQNGTVDDNNVVAQGALARFAVTAGSNRYDAVIDHYAGTVKIGKIKNLEEIDGVDYELRYDDATIFPAPESFLDNWAKEQTVVVARNGIESPYSIIFTRYSEPVDYPDDPTKPGGPSNGFDYTYRPDFLPKDDECKVYAEPYLPFTAESMPVGAKHPNPELAAAGWKLYTVNEFTDGVETVLDETSGATVILPHGLYPFNTEMMNESAKVSNEECSRVEDGRLIMEAYRLDAPISTGFKSNYSKDGMVQYKHASYRAYPSRNKNYGDWFSMHTNMRFEVRYRRSNTQGFNNAVWFQGNCGGDWPTYGEIDLVENPKRSATSQLVYSTLHHGTAANHKNPGGTVTMEDLTRWNIFWLELYPEKVVFGVNGRTIHTQTKKATDTTFELWPWDQEDGFYLILSTGMYDPVHSSRDSWTGPVRPIDFEDPNNLPSMEFDWIRVYVNDDFDREEAMNIYY